MVHGIPSCPAIDPLRFEECAFVFPDAKGKRADRVSLGTVWRNGSIEIIVKS
jgi:hypothetical protein